jgi:hypothetical protein
VTYITPPGFFRCIPNTNSTVYLAGLQRLFLSLFYVYKFGIITQVGKSIHCVVHWRSFTRYFKVILDTQFLDWLCLFFNG